MEYSAKFIIAMFNKSKSGKSWIYVDGQKMYILSDAVYHMARLGDIVDILFSPAGDLKNDDGSVAFNTWRVKDWTESMTSKLRARMEEVEAIEAFDQERFNAAQAKLEGLTL